MTPPVLPFVSPIGDPVRLGISTAAASLTQTITTAFDVPAGAFIGVVCAVNSSSQQITAASDNGGVNGAYTVLDASTVTDVPGIAWIINGASILPAGSIITVTRNSGASTGRVGAFSITGLNAAPIDTHAHATSGAGATSSTQVNTGALAQASEIVLLFAAGATSNSNWAAPSMTTMVFSAASTWIYMGWVKVNSTASFGGTSSWTTASTYGANIISLKAA